MAAMVGELFIDITEAGYPAGEDLKAGDIVCLRDGKWYKCNPDEPIADEPIIVEVKS